MYRYSIYIVIVLIILVAIGGVLWFFHFGSPSTSSSGASSSLYPNIPAPTGSTPNGGLQAVKTAFQNARAPYDHDNTKLYGTSIAGDYALQVWEGDNMAGEALLKYDNTQGQWVVITGGGGEWDVDELVLAGVPRDTATALLANLPLQ